MATAPSQDSLFFEISSFFEVVYFVKAYKMCFVPWPVILLLAKLNSNSVQLVSMHSLRAIAPSSSMLLSAMFNFSIVLFLHKDLDIFFAPSLDMLQLSLAHNKICDKGIQSIAEALLVNTHLQ